RRALIAHVESADPIEHVLVARFERDDAIDDAGIEPPPARLIVSVAAIVRVAAAIALVFALAFGR
ncbi:MAG TPA: hypothetical protein VGF86_09985, partial [Candidatus Tumulicola sp.]